jgi:hypothetical protein
LFGGTANAKLGSTDDATGGLYGAGRYGFSGKYNVTTAFTTASGNFTTASATANDVQQDAAYTSSTLTFVGGTKITINLASNSQNIDLNAARSLQLSGSGITVSNILNDYTKVLNTGSLANPYYQLVFIHSGSVNLTAAGGNAYVLYSTQPTDSTRGDFEDKFSPANAGTSGLSADIGIPEVNLELKSEPIVAKTRKLKAVWTPELAQDLNAYHSIDAEAELTALLSEYVSMEIDLEILDMLITSAPAVTTEAWSAAIGTEFTAKTVGANGSVTWSRTTDTTNRTAYVKNTWFQTLGNKIQKVSNKIHQLTLRGGANFLVCGPDVATILESIPGYVVSTDGDSAKFAMGVSRVGSFASRFQVYKNPYMQENTILVGFRGNNFLETGAVYSPYIPLVQTPLVYDPVNFTPRRGVMTRYAKKVVRPEFYGKIYVADLDQV